MIQLIFWLGGESAIWEAYIPRLQPGSLRKRAGSQLSGRTIFPACSQEASEQRRGVDYPGELYSPPAARKHQNKGGESAVRGAYIPRLQPGSLRTKAGSQLSGRPIFPACSQEASEKGRGVNRPGGLYSPPADASDQNKRKPTHDPKILSFSGRCFGSEQEKTSA